MKIAFIAHDGKKDQLVEFVTAYESILSKHTLCATRATGRRIIKATRLQVEELMSGPLGGDQQIGAMIISGVLDLVVFFRDPLTVQPHGSDINALLRLCDVYNIPLATNVASADILIKAAKSKLFPWRGKIHEYGVEHQFKHHKSTDRVEFQPAKGGLNAKDLKLSKTANL